MKFSFGIEAPEKLSEEFRSAGFFRRALRVVGEFASSVFLLFFSVTWSAMSGFALFGALFPSEKERATAAVCVAAAFLLFGAALFVFSLVRIVCLARVFWAASKIGKSKIGNGVPAPAPETEENPFSSVEDVDASEDDGDAACSRAEESVRGRVALGVFGFVFFVVGIAGSVVGVKKYFREEAAAGTWISAPCRVVSAELERRRGSKGGTTYEPNVVFEFSANGKTFRGDKIFMELNSSSSDYSKEKRRLDECRARTECWFDPANPENCALMPPQRGFSPRKILLAVFGVPFWLIGGGIALGAVFGGRSRRKKDSPPAPREEGLLREDADPASSPLVLMFFAVAWNSIVAVFVVGIFCDGAPPPLFLLFIALFVVIGVVILICAVRAAAGRFNPRYAVKILRTGTLFPQGGADTRVLWKIVRGDPARVRSLKIEFVRLQDSKLVVNGKPKKKIVGRVPVSEAVSRAMIASGEAEVSVPADVPRGEWRLRVAAKTAGTPLVPDLRQDFFIR